MGHLDVMRYFQKVMRRADVDIAYSEGYSPHQLMSFAQPLSVGATSDGEYVDIVLAGESGFNTEGETVREHAAEEAFADSLKERINRVCHEGIKITDAMVLPEKAEKAMTLVAACAWRVALREKAAKSLNDAGDGSVLFRDFLAQPRITARKKSKKGLTEPDIKPMIYRADRDEDGVFHLLLKSGSEDNVKPALFLGAFLRYANAGDEEWYLEGDELKPSLLELHRVETYRSRHEETGLRLEPLIAKG